MTPVRSCATCHHYEPLTDWAAGGDCTEPPTWVRVKPDHYCGRYRISEAEIRRTPAAEAVQMFAKDEGATR